MPHARTAGCAFAVVTLISLGVVLDCPSSVPQLPVLAARSLMSARPRRKERWNQDRLLHRVRGRSCINLITQRHGRTPPVKKESQRRWYRKRLTAMSSLFRYRFRVASEVHLGRHIMIVVLPGLTLQRCNVICKLLTTGHQKSIGPSSCQCRISGQKEHMVPVANNYIRLLSLLHVKEQLQREPRPLL